MQYTLTPKQEAFCLLIVKGETQSSAYEQAGYSSTSLAVTATSANKLLKIPKIQARVAELRGALVRKTMITLESLTDDLINIRDKSVAAGSYGPAVQSVLALARLHGLLIEKSEVSIMHRPAPLPTKVLELSEDDWVRQFGVEGRQQLLKVASK